MPLDSRRVSVARRVSIAALWCAMLAGTLAAQPGAVDPQTLAARAVDNKLYGSERLQAAHGLVAFEGSEWIGFAFETITVVAARFDNLEREMTELERRVAILGKDGAILGVGRPTAEQYTALRQKRDLENLRKDFNEEEMVLRALRKGVRGRLMGPPGAPKAVEQIVQRIDKLREAEKRAAALRALGFFPVAAARAAATQQLTARSPVVAMAAMRALQDLARAMAAFPDEGGCWPEAYASLRQRLTRTWKDRDEAHRAYRTLSARHVKYLHKVGLKTTAQLKKLVRGMRPKALPESVMRKLSQLEEERKAAAATLRELESRIEVGHETLACVFGCMSEAQCAAVEPPLMAGLGKLNHQDSSIRLVKLCACLRSDGIHGALVAAAATKAPEARLAVCDALARHRRAEAVPALVERLQDVFWQVRLAAIRALQTIGGKPAIDAFVETLAEADGLVQHEVNSALCALTGKNFHSNAVLWRTWWTENRAEYVGPPEKKKAGKKRRDARPSARAGRDPTAKREAPVEESADENGAVSFYGIRTRSKRVIFVLDVSGSMYGDMNGLHLLGAVLGTLAKESDRKINHARAQMQLSIVSLPPDAVFNIVTYGTKVKSWKQEPKPATTDNKAAARKWVDKIEPEGQTNIFDAIVRALGMVGSGKAGRLKPSAADTIYLLTDGHANRGAVIDPAEMLEEIGRLNESRRVTIHAVALGVGADSAFMRRLAKRFNGRFVHLKSTIAGK